MSEAHDLELAELLDRLVQRSQAGESVRIDDVIGEHPHLEADIRELWATAMFASDVGRQHSDVVARQLSAGEARSRDRIPNPNPGTGFRDDSFRGRIIGDYELIDEIGRGGMGVVYRARQQGLNRTVALKMIPDTAFATPQDAARLRSEATAAGRLNHPNIVSVYDVGEHDGSPYFSMPLIMGENLSRRLMNGPLPARDAAALLLPIVKAVAAAHEAGILHRDLKPSNILIDETGKAFVSDFGLAKHVPAADASGVLHDPRLHETLTQTGAILGTPSWMAPEQAAGDRERVGPQADVYSLGAILYAMLTGRPPFQAASPLDTLLMVLEQDPPLPRVLNDRVDPDLEMIALKCLQKPIDLRYQSAGDLAADLEAFLEGEPIRARSTHLADVFVRLFRESHHVSVLQNWGLLWMWHSLVLLMLCLLTNAFQLFGVQHRWPYVTLWVFGLGLWAGCFWNLRGRGGPILAVERHVAHVWAGSMFASSMLFAVEWLLNLPALRLSPVLGTIAGIVFLVKAGLLSGRFYIQALLLFLTAPVMAVIQTHSPIDFSVALFGVVSAATFFFPGLKYYRLQRRA